MSRHALSSLWLFLATVLVAVTGTVALSPGRAEAACSGVGSPRVRYVCGTVSANSAIYTGLSYKYYNEMYEGLGHPLGIFLEDSAGSRFYYDYANSYVYRTFSSGYVRAFCWNRHSTTITARCDYVNG